MFVAKLLFIDYYLLWFTLALEKLHLSKYLDTGAVVYTDIYVFYKLIQISPHGCIQDCQSRKRCQGFNYIRRSNLCLLLGANGGAVTSLKDLFPKLTSRPGYVFSARSEWFINDSDACSTCPDYGDCSSDVTRNDTSVISTCKSSGCKHPSQNRSILYGTQYLPGSKVRYSCNIDYSLRIATTNTAACQSNGEWSATNFTCLYDCGILIVENGQFAATSGTTEGMTAALYCNFGYVFLGSSLITCTETGWDGNATCTLIDCGIPTIANGTFTAPSGTTFGMSATLLCNTGYEMSGNPLITCTESGWNGHGTCTPIDCGILTIANGTFTAPTGTTFGMIATLSCNTGYNLLGNSLITCTETGWNEQATCILINCGILTIANGTFTAPTGTTFAMSATLSCYTGYNLSGNSFITCTETGWNGKAICTLIDCGILTIADGTFTAPTGPTFGMSATLSCNTGYNLSGNSLISCTETGWSGEATCTLIESQTLPYENTSEMTWSAAKSYCESLGGHLVDVNTYEKQLILQDFIAANGDFIAWTGGNDIALEGEFRWSDNTLVSDGYSNWNGNQPDGKFEKDDCVTIIPQWNYKWNDGSCTRSLKGICET